MKQLLYAFILLLLFACSKDERSTQTPRFSLLAAEETSIDFRNDLKYDRTFNVYRYRNFYNGGGVALGDVNGDGLQDIYFTGNMQPNRLYLNRGDFQFEDVTTAAGVAGERAWSTGVAMVDINADGWMDIYVCNSGNVEGDNKENELFINQGNGTFTEEAEAYGIADKGFSTHGVFFDYDKDGDLDLYLLNNSFKAIGSFNLRKNERPKRDPIGGDKLYRNEGNSFVDVSEEAGIYGSIIGFGLGVTVGDIDRDGWQDIYVSNDFFERDYLYINNGDGTFREELEQQMRSISAASMGADMGDINNDGYPEIFVTEMLPEKDGDIKQKTTFEGWNRYQYSLENDYYHQFTRNMLHLNNTDGTFSEIGRIAGVEATDWSWGALICDLDNDGWRDIFVANGIYQDLTDQDYIDFIANEETQRTIVAGGKGAVDYKALIDSIPVRPVPNYAFQNKQNLLFENKAKDWGLAQLGHANGSAYGDLDNDGDLDLVINNVNMLASIYRNETDSTANYLQFSLEGEGKNLAALGTKITLKYGEQSSYIEHMPMRAFQSSMDYHPHFGLGEVAQVDSVIVEWVDGRSTVLTDVAANQRITLRQSEGSMQVDRLWSHPSTTPIFTQTNPPNFTHKENRFSDFDVHPLIYHMNSTEGPKIAVADVNTDGQEDFYIGGAQGQSGELFFGQADGSFLASGQAVFTRSVASEDIDAEFFDGDGDGDQDLYVVSGGTPNSMNPTALLDRLYLNDGAGNFTESSQRLPRTEFMVSSCVEAADYDGDGDQDLFVGTRMRPNQYGLRPTSYLLENDGKGNFQNVAPERAPDLKRIGMVTDAIWSDYDGDTDLDLLIVGEWMPVQIFENKNGNFRKKEAFSNSNGWWNCIKAADIDADGDMDYVVGNHGLNSRFEASADEPIYLYVNDFDGNKTAEQILCRYEDGVLLPMVRRADLVNQLPHLKKKYLRYNNYVGETMEDIFTPEELKGTLRLEANTLASSLLLNSGNGSFEVHALPFAAQLAPIYGLALHDFDKDGHMDILLAGNFHSAKPEVGRYDANYGTFLKGDGKDGFVEITPKDSGFRLDGEVRDLEVLNDKIVLVGKCNAAPSVFRFLE